MVVVTITGILAALAISLTRKYLDSSRTSEAMSTISAIRAAQEEWRAHNQSYFNVSTTRTSWYPMATPNATRFAWRQAGGADYANWELLRPRVDWLVQFGYATFAGNAGTAVGALGTIADQPDLGTPDQPWYVIQAQADVDADGQVAYFVATSLTSEIFSENAGE
jgi:type II secretory pathway pseudopilin PulG